MFLDIRSLVSLNLVYQKFKPPALQILLYGWAHWQAIGGQRAGGARRIKYLLYVTPSNGYTTMGLHEVPICFQWGLSLYWCLAPCGGGASVCLAPRRRRASVTPQFVHDFPQVVQVSVKIVTSIQRLEAFFEESKVRSDQAVNRMRQWSMRDFHTNFFLFFFFYFWAPKERTCIRSKGAC